MEDADRKGLIMFLRMYVDLRVASHFCDVFGRGDPRVWWVQERRTSCVVFCEHELAMSGRDRRDWDGVHVGLGIVTRGAADVGYIGCSNP